MQPFMFQLVSYNSNGITEHCKEREMSREITKAFVLDYFSS